MNIVITDTAQPCAWFMISVTPVTIVTQNQYNPSLQPPREHTCLKARRGYPMVQLLS
jgi:hypothetical protein